MPGGFPNKPKILRGAFVEYGLSIPPLVVVFQFNPVELSRNRALSFKPPNVGSPSPLSPNAKPAEKEAFEEEMKRIRREREKTLRDFHQGKGEKERALKEKDSLLEIRDKQVVTVEEESISFDIRLDATDKLNDGDDITEQFGIEPQLSTLELMVLPKGESLLGSLLNAPGGFSFTKRDNPPMVLFIWGRKRVLPVNINSMNITETEFSTDLNPIRATVAVSLKVVEGKNRPYTYSKAMKEAMSVLNLANVADIADVVIPG